MQFKKEKTGILFLHHEINEIVLNNLQSAKRHNPEATIATISAGPILPNGYTIDATPDIKKLHSDAPTRSSDWLVCSWFLQRREKCEKWWIIEWDTFCRVSLRKYYSPVWEFPFVASSIRLPYRDPQWIWFREFAYTPEEYFPYLMGATPFLYLVSDAALIAICKTLLKKSFICGNGELRFATTANKCGFPPCGYSPPDDQITWINWESLSDRKTIFHPVKHYVQK
jgi:hypothetical protein